jgi:hypothetical protein
MDRPTAIPTAAPTVEPRPPESSIQQRTVVPLDPALQQIVSQAKEDLARRLGISIASVTTDAVIGQEFSTEAFNCRTPKGRIVREESPQVSGTSILLSALGRRYEYHANDQVVVFCRPLP